MNLWADFESESQHLSASMNRRQTRRLTEQVVLSSVREWLLQDYVSAYCRALGARRIYRRRFLGGGWGGGKTPAAKCGWGCPSNGGREGGKAVRAPLLWPVYAVSRGLGQEGTIQLLSWS